MVSVNIDEEEFSSEGHTSQESLWRLSITDEDDIDLECNWDKHNQNSWFTDAAYQVKVLSQKKGVPDLLDAGRKKFTSDNYWLRCESLDWEYLRDPANGYDCGGNVTFETFTVSVKINQNGNFISEGNSIQESLWRLFLKNTVIYLGFNWNKESQPEWFTDADYQVKVLSHKEEVPDLLEKGRKKLRSPGHWYHRCRSFDWGYLRDPANGYVRDGEVTFETFTIPVTINRDGDFLSEGHSTEEFVWSLSVDEWDICLNWSCFNKKNIFSDAKYQLKVHSRKEGVPDLMEEGRISISYGDGYHQSRSFDWSYLRDPANGYVRDGEVTFEVTVEVLATTSY